MLKRKLNLIDKYINPSKRFLDFGCGVGSLVLETLNSAGHEAITKVVRLGIPDEFAPEYGSQDSLLNRWGLDSDSLANCVISRLAAK